MILLRMDVIIYGLILIVSSTNVRSTKRNISSQGSLRKDQFETLLKLFPVLTTVEEGSFNGPNNPSAREDIESSNFSQNSSQHKQNNTHLPSLDIFPAESFKFPMFNNKSDSKNSTKPEDLNEGRMWSNLVADGKDPIEKDSKQNVHITKQAVSKPYKSPFVNSSSSYQPESASHKEGNPKPLPNLAQRRDGQVQPLSAQDSKVSGAHDTDESYNKCDLIRELKSQYTVFSHRNIFDVFSDSNDDIHEQYMKCVKAKRRKLQKPKATGMIHEDAVAKNSSSEEQHFQTAATQPVFKMAANQTANITQGDHSAVSNMNVKGFQNEEVVVGRNFTVSESLHQESRALSKRVLCFGDSLTYGYTESGEGKHPYSIRLKELLKGDPKSRYEILTRGYVGHCVFHQLAEKLRSVIAELKPLDLIIIWGGTNDLLNYNCEPEIDLFMEILRMHEISHEMNIKTVALTIPEALYSNKSRTASKEKFTHRWKSVNQKIRLYQQLHSDMVILCDLARKFRKLSLTKEENTMLWDDETHPTATGYDIIGEIIYRDIAGKF